MRGPYLALARISFTDQVAYRLRTFIGILNILIVVVVNMAIWKALYAGNASLRGVAYSTTATNLILGIGISSVLWVNEFAVARRIRSGDIAIDLLRPANFALSILASNLGLTAYRLLIEFLPAILIAGLAFGLSPPASALAFGFFALSLALGYLLLFTIGFILSTIAFWYFNIWSFVTIKNALIALLSGVFLPYWFMPDWLKGLIAFTPFDSLWAIPLQCWMGMVGPGRMLLLVARQCAWLVGLGGLAWLLWRSGCRKLTVQGG